MFDFPKKKFLALPLERRHKKCAELLRAVYDKCGREEKHSPEWEHYLELLDWMEEPPSQTMPPSIKGIADLYHAHLKKAHVSKREHHFLPQIRRGDRPQGEEAWPIAIYLDGLRSAHNVGSVIRTAEALSLGTLYFSPATPFASHKQVKDTAMGADQWITCAQGVGLASLPRPIIALETSEEAVSLYEFIFPPSFTLVLGNEEYGCSDEALALSDYLVEIPLRGRKNSLNAANAFAIAAGEISRQKNVVKLKGKQ